MIAGWYREVYAALTAIRSASDKRVLDEAYRFKAPGVHRRRTLVPERIERELRLLERLAAVHRLADDALCRLDSTMGVPEWMTLCPAAEEEEVEVAKHVG